MRRRISLLVLALFATGLSAAEPEFRPLFNGKDLTGWDGDPRLWSVAGGAIRGRTTLGSVPLRNTFLIWRGGTLKDFELRVSFRIQSGNSGIQYRSRDLGKWAVSGYQAEIENKPGKAGFLYEEKGRGWLARVGERAEAGADGTVRKVGTLTSVDALIAQRYYRVRDWNEYRIVARDGHLQHWLNGFQVVDFTDRDASRRAAEGVLALQIHAGPPMAVEFKDILLKPL